MEFFFPFEEPDTFTQFFSKVGTSKGGVQMRYNFYPMVPDVSTVKPGQIRCGEHTDYGAISVLFQDEIGGLEVHVQCSQEYIKMV